MFRILKFVLKQISRLIVWRHKPEIITITGSAGKTSTKEAIYAVLRDKFFVRKSEGNFNNEIGIPLAIIGRWREKDLKLVSLDQTKGAKKFGKLIFWLRVIIKGLFLGFFPFKSKYPQILLLEYGAAKPGDIRYLTGIARPKIGVITAIGDIPVHVEFYSGPEAVVKEKAKLIESLPNNGFAVLNADEKSFDFLKEKTKTRIMTFGFSELAGIRISNFENVSIDSKPEGIYFKIEYMGNFLPVKLNNVFGRSHAYAAATAFAVGIIYNLNLVEISSAIEKKYLPPKSRMNLVRGIKETWLIDDSYNASPMAMKEALWTLKNLNVERRIAVLGDMLELGRYSIEAHEEIGKIVAQSANILITVGPRGKFIGQAAKEAGMPENKIFSFDTADEAKKPIQDLIRKGDLILIKASHAIGLDKIVEEIKEM